MREVVTTNVFRSPLLIDPMDRDTIVNDLYYKRRDTKAATVTPEELAAKKMKMLMKLDGRVYLPIVNFLSCIVAGGQNVKRGKKGISTAETTTLFEFFELLDPEVEITGIDGQPPKWVTDIRMGWGKQAKVPTAVAIIRPRIDEAMFQLRFRYNEKIVGRQTVVDLLTQSWLTKGIGSFRPGKGRGPYGRAVITDWVESVAQDVISQIKFVLPPEDRKAA